MGILFQDTFNRADGDPANDWTIVAGTWDIHTNQLRCHAWPSYIKRLMPSGAVNNGSITLLSGPDMVWSAGNNVDLWLR